MQWQEPRNLSCKRPNFLQFWTRLGKTDDKRSGLLLQESDREPNAQRIYLLYHGKVGSYRAQEGVYPPPRRGATSFTAVCGGKVSEESRVSGRLSWCFNREGPVWHQELDKDFRYLDTDERCQRLFVDDITKAFELETFVDFAGMRLGEHLDNQDWSEGHQYQSVKTSLYFNVFGSSAS